MDESSTCLSSDDHGPAILNHVLHFLGCLTYTDRAGFFEDSNPLWQDEIDHEVSLGMNPTRATGLVFEKRESWRADCLKELQRIEVVRQALSHDGDERDLVWNSATSLALWRQSPVYSANEHLARQHAGEGRIHNTEAARQEAEPYDLASDIKIPIIHLEGSVGVQEPYWSDGRVWGKFPNQHTTAEHVLGNLDPKNVEENLLHKDRHFGGIRYIHFPANNMIVSLI